jgi:hypothetical protein
MALKIEQLDEQGYQLQTVLQHEELVPFIQDIFKKPNLITRLFIFLNIVLLAWLIGWGVYEIVARDKSFGWVLMQLSLGILLILPVIPLHEWLHGLAYKWLGAEKVHYTANFKKFYFTAQAHHFIVGEKGFYWLAFTPFVLINSMTIILMFVLPASYLLLLISFLFMHTTACGGDFALAAYFYSRKHTGLITYDDVPSKKTYFYAPVFE